MSGILLTGDTSGTLTLAAPAVAGTNTLTLPAKTGTILTDVTPGTVLQVVQATASPSFNTTSGSFVSTGFSASITPKSSTSKILVCANSIGTNGGNNQSNYTIYRNSTNLGGGSQSSLAFYYSSSGYSWVPVTLQYLDSPSTTSSVTYTVYMYTVGGTSGWYGSSNILSTFTLTEIAA